MDLQPHSTSSTNATEAASLSKYEHLLGKVAGVMFGSAIGDALGWPTEFIRSRKQLKRLLGIQELVDFRPWEKKTGGRFNTYIDYIMPGEYSDDTQLTLCTARSLQPDGSFDADYFAKTELSTWLEYSRGAGATITRAAGAISRKSSMWNNNFFSYGFGSVKRDYTQAGANGAAMRIAPIALANVWDEEKAVHEAWKNTIVTHGHPRAIIGALVYTKSLLYLLGEVHPEFERFIAVLKEFISHIGTSSLEPALQEWLERWERHTELSFSTELNRTKSEMIQMIEVAAASRERPLNEIYKQLGCLEPSTKGSGTATVAASLAVFLRFGRNYEKAVLNAVNMLGSDTDTIAAMVGGMVGAVRGQIAIPEKWFTRSQDYAYFVRVSEALTRIALRLASAKDLYIDHQREKYEGESNIVSLAKRRLVREGERVTHPLFGLGWVSKAYSQRIRRRSGGTMLLAKVTFDIGQSNVFRAYLSDQSRHI